jgi:hypothetical protein
MMMDDSELGPLELKLEELEVWRESARMMCDALILQSRFFFEKAEAVEKSLSKIWYHRRALRIQRRAIRYSIKSSEYLSKYINLREQSIVNINETAHDLGYKARLEPTPPSS